MIKMANTKPLSYHRKKIFQVGIRSVEAPSEWRMHADDNECHQGKILKLPLH